MSVTPEALKLLGDIGDITKKADLERLGIIGPLKRRLEVKKGFVYHFPLDLSAIDKQGGNYGILAFRRFNHGEAIEISTEPIMLEYQKQTVERKPFTKEQLHTLFQFYNRMLAKVLVEDSTMAAEELNELGDERFTNAAYMVICQYSGLTNAFLLTVTNTIQWMKDSAMV